MGQIKFGTDGWRAVIAEDFTFANVERVAQATADYWSAHPVSGTEKKIVIGYDRRFLSDQFARRTAEVFCGNGFNVVLTAQPTPTPAVSFAVKARRAVGGVMITASHNPPAFNGFKLKAHFGGSAEPAMCQGVEALLDKNPVRARLLERNPRVRTTDIRPAHYAAIKKLVGIELRNQYSMAYQSTNANKDGKFRKIKVEVVDENGMVVKNVVVRAKEGYQAPKG